ncbi:MAG: T9SS type A sorting domain-containing protein, partial [Niabella sp.]
TGTTRTVNVTPPNNSTTLYTVSDGMGCVTDQFSVVTSGVLPVSILSYDVRLNGGKVDVNWSTATEINSKDYTIERSANAVDYTPIGAVPAAGNSNTVLNYAFADYNPLLGTSYYRLSQTDLDGSKEYLGVKKIINNKGKDFEVRAISPGNGVLALQINSSNQSVYQLRVFDISGRERKNESISCNAGICQKEFSLGAGVYVCEIVNSKGEKLSQKVLIK